MVIFIKKKLNNKIFNLKIIKANLIKIFKKNRNKINLNSNNYLLFLKFKNFKKIQ